MCLCTQCQATEAEYLIDTRSRSHDATTNEIIPGSSKSGSEYWCGDCIDELFPNGNVTADTVLKSTRNGITRVKFASYVGPLDKEATSDVQGSI